MYTELQEKWLQELESGNTTKEICRMSEFYDGKLRECCLGVAARVCNLSSDKLYLTKIAADTLRLRDVEGSFDSYVEFDNKTHKSLAELNDNSQATHQDIARIIRENPANVFTNF